ncbi:hypothetical protein KJ780_01295 [Candidatus Micrarchaeota archaeon]|nr:hypothetical protein [Candidatus Micrarchaeota archaeon]
MGADKKVCLMLEDFLKKEGFEIIGCEMEKGQEAEVLFEFVNPELQKNKIVYGPPLEFPGDVEKFAKKYNDVFVLDGRAAVKIARKERKVEQMISRVRKLPSPSHLQTSKTKLYKDEKAIDKCKEVIQRYIVSMLTV